MGWGRRKYWMQVRREIGRGGGWRALLAAAEQEGTRHAILIIVHRDTHHLASNHAICVRVLLLEQSTLFALLVPHPHPQHTASSLRRTAATACVAMAVLDQRCALSSPARCEQGRQVRPPVRQGCVSDLLARSPRGRS
jgi:hypothetical protein